MHKYQNKKKKKKNLEIKAERKLHKDHLLTLSASWFTSRAFWGRLVYFDLEKVWFPLLPQRLFQCFPWNLCLVFKVFPTSKDLVQGPGPQPKDCRQIPTSPGLICAAQASAVRPGSTLPPCPVILCIRLPSPVKDQSHVRSLGADVWAQICTTDPRPGDWAEHLSPRNT